MGTIRDSVERSLRLLGVKASGEALEASELTDGILAFNRMLESWAVDGILVNAITREVFTLVAGTQTYLMGTGQTFNTTRPIRIESAGIISNGFEYPMESYTSLQWAAINNKSQGTNIPEKFYAEGTATNETINVWPVPNSAVQIAIYSEKPFTEYATGSETLALAPGYADAIEYNLAVRLAPEYGKSAAAEVVEIAQNTREAIMRKNVKPQYMASDLVRNYHYFNINSGE